MVTKQDKPVRILRRPGLLAAKSGQFGPTDTARAPPKAMKHPPMMDSAKHFMAGKFALAVPISTACKASYYFTVSHCRFTVPVARFVRQVSVSSNMCDCMALGLCYICGMIALDGKSRSATEALPWLECQQEGAKVVSLEPNLLVMEYCPAAHWALHCLHCWVLMFGLHCLSMLHC